MTAEPAALPLNGQFSSHKHLRMPDAFATLAVVAFGWFLNELAHARRAGAATRGAIGRVIADLLDIRHRLRSGDLILNEIGKRVALSAADRAQFLPLLNQIFPPDPELQNRLRHTISDIAAVRPLLAFRLMGKETSLQIMATFEALTTPLAEPSATLPVSSLLRAELIEVLDETLSGLSLAHGVTTWWSIRSALRRPLALPDKIVAILDTHIAEAVANSTDA